MNTSPTPATTWSAPTTTSTTSEEIQTGTATTAELPSTAVIPSSVPTLIVPANSVVNQKNAGSGNKDDPLLDTTLISLLLAAEQYPWTFVVRSSDATSQLFNTFPSLVANALQIPVEDVQTYGLQVYQPASWTGDQAALLTQWMAYIPTKDFETLQAYLQAKNSPLFTQQGIQGDLAAQINTAFPLAAATGPDTSRSSSVETDNGSTRTRDIIIGVCVGIGGLLWIGLVLWIYKRVKRNNQRDVHKRLSEHMSMFDARDQQRRVSMVPSLAPSDVDDRPSSFYASPADNDPVFRRQQRQAERGASYHDYSSDESHGYSHNHPRDSWYNDQSEMRQHGGPATYGLGNAHGGYGHQQAQPLNPFEDMVTRSYLHASGSGRDFSAPPSATGSGSMGHAQRRAAPGKPVQKAMIGQPNLQASSLEFREY